MLFGFCISCWRDLWLGLVKCSVLMIRLLDLSWCSGFLVDKLIMAAYFWFFVTTIILCILRPGNCFYLVDIYSAFSLVVGNSYLLSSAMGSFVGWFGWVKRFCEICRGWVRFFFFWSTASKASCKLLVSGWERAHYSAKRFTSRDRSLLRLTPSFAVSARPALTLSIIARLTCVI